MRLAYGRYTDTIFFTSHQHRTRLSTPKDKSIPRINHACCFHDVKFDHSQHSVEILVLFFLAGISQAKPGYITLVVPVYYSSILLTSFSTWSALSNADTICLQEARCCVISGFSTKISPIKSSRYKLLSSSTWHTHHVLVHHGSTTSSRACAKVLKRIQKWQTLPNSWLTHSLCLSLSGYKIHIHECTYAMYMCLCVSIYIHIYIYIYTHTHNKYTHTYLHTDTCIHVVLYLYLLATCSFSYAHI